MCIRDSRYSSENMSADLTRMFRSWLWARDSLHREDPAREPYLDVGTRRYAAWLMGCAGRGDGLLHLAPLVRLFAREGVLGYAARSASWNQLQHLRSRLGERRWPAFTPRYHGVFTPGAAQ